MKKTDEVRLLIKKALLTTNCLLTDCIDIGEDESLINKIQEIYDSINKIDEAYEKLTNDIASLV